MSRLETARQMAEDAKTADTPTCLYGEKVFYLEGPEGLVPGHIYSEAGIREFRMSNCCEYHFDHMFAEPLE